MNVKKIANLIILISATLLISSVALFGCICSKYDQGISANQANIPVMDVNDREYVEPKNLTIEIEPWYEWSFDPEQDLQNPELPTGCEATAAATLLRMNGTYVTKTEIANALPKSESSGEFVYTFWGDPYSQNGWACMSPCIATVLSEFKRPEQTIKLLNGVDLNQLPLPCEIWVTMGLQEPWWTDYEQDGYRLPWNPHAIVITDIQDNTVFSIDPTVGIIEYNYDSVNYVYEALGKQAIYIENR